jgi:hypothetical protein
VAKRTKTIAAQIAEGFGSGTKWRDDVGARLEEVCAQIAHSVTRIDADVTKAAFRDGSAIYITAAWWCTDEAWAEMAGQFSN